MKKNTEVAITTAASKTMKKPLFAIGCRLCLLRSMSRTTATSTPSRA